MELTEIKEFSIDSGAPCPTIIAGDNHLFLMFYESVAGAQLRERTADDKGIVVIKFKLSMQHRFGLPNNEIIQGHPYYKLGMRSNAFYEMRDSIWVSEMIQIAKVHPYFDQSRWKDVRHYILTFHDSFFECLAKGYEVEFENKSIYSQVMSLFEELTDQ